MNDQISELKKSTLVNYISKASSDLYDKGVKRTKARYTDGLTPEDDGKGFKKILNRMGKISTAARKLAEEQNESSINEERTSKTNESIINLIGAIASEDTIDSAQCFNDALMSKITGIIDVRRQEVAQSMFNEATYMVTHDGHSNPVGEYKEFPQREKPYTNFITSHQDDATKTKKLLASKGFNNVEIRKNGKLLYIDDSTGKLRESDTSSVKSLDEEHVGYYVAGHVDTHGGQEGAGTKDFKVKFADHPGKADIAGQNPHLVGHEVEAISNHIDQHCDDDMSDTTSEQRAGGKSHDVYIKSNKPVMRK